MMSIVFWVTLWTSSSLLGITSAVDTANGERVGGCPTPQEVSDMSRDTTPTANECSIDSDCTGNALYKCCQDKDTNLNLCVLPKPACRDGTKLDPSDVFDGTCDENKDKCIDRGCNNGPEGEGGWGSSCCGGYAFEWVSGAERPTCGDGVEPEKDSEGEYFWCGSDSARPCPQNTKCVTDKSSYEICCADSSATGSGYNLLGFIIAALVTLITLG